MRGRLEELRASAAKVDAFIKNTKRYTTIDGLTPELFLLFIKCIEIGECNMKYAHLAVQRIRIDYRDTGAVDYAMGPEEQ